MDLSRTSRDTLLDIAEKNRRMRALKNKTTFKDGVNQRASIKQRQLTDTIIKAADCSANMVEIDLCKKELFFSDLPYIDSLRISYFTKNNLFSRIFELIIESDFVSSAENKIKSDIELQIAYKGRLKASDVRFTALPQDETGGRLADRLNQVALISDRILYLEALDLKIRFCSASNTWTIGFATGKGSTVWALFPPMLMLVPFKEADAIRLLELYQLLTYEIKRFESDGIK